MKCTHVALQVRDIDASVRFYERFCEMTVVHERRDAKSHVIWMGWGEDPPLFVIVLIAEHYEQNVQPAWQHIGMAVETREQVDALFKRATADRIGDLWEPIDAGPIVGYYCAVPDPDGNRVEFSCGQRIG